MVEPTSDLWLEPITLWQRMFKFSLIMLQMLQATVHNIQFTEKHLLHHFHHFLDYDAPLTEAGHYTSKYDRAAEMIAAYDILAEDLKKPPRPEIVLPITYPTVVMDEFLDFETIVSNVVSNKKFESKTW